MITSPEILLPIVGAAGGALLLLLLVVELASTCAVAATSVISVKAEVTRSAAHTSASMSSKSSSV
jgi:hypothetical protein